ncbi:MAG: TetR/AcrR family transcriptional regulator, transcriptional repressor for nem operon [Actinomycetota bacterium]|nr:TetR/AcrR family transcriptional regulator, transcriptional repressor for nem operon [Actinomycetota bacterium]
MVGTGREPGTEHRESTRDRLVEATADLLWERGYGGVSPKAIQLRAGAGQGSMYHHFRGKRDLAVAALEQAARTSQEGAAVFLNGQEPPLDRLIAYLTRPRDALKGCRIGRMTQDPDVLQDPELREPIAGVFTWLLGELTCLIEQAQRSGDLDPGLDPADTAATLSAVLQGAHVLARAADDPEPFDRALRGSLALLALAERPPS